MTKVKTIAMRLLDKAGVAYEVLEYRVDENDLSGEHVAKLANIDPNTVFKTLVLIGEHNGYFVCCIPSNGLLDLKKAARSFNDKGASLLHLKDLKDITGYIRGGCSPLGMKKSFPLFMDETCILYDKIYVSGGKRGLMLLLNYQDLLTLSGGTQADLLQYIE